jgi:hypothetical protein
MTFLMLAQLDNCSPETKFFFLRFYMTNAYDLPDILNGDLQPSCPNSCV